MSKHSHGCQCLGFLACTQMLMQLDARRGFMNTIRDSALEVASGRKMPCRTGDLILCQYCTWLFSQTPYQHSYPCQIYVYKNYILKRKGKLSHLYLLFLVLLWGINITLTQGSVIVCLCCCFSGSQPVKNIGDLGPVKIVIQFTGPSLTSVH